MAKILLVEDDNNLREIYGARLMAEGHKIVSAQDGEEALAVAVKEKPDLIIADVMMPRVSGFEMLDILRNAPETKNTKVIIMTALSEAEDKKHADKLGADKYLVKSQVTLEDVAQVVKDVLGEKGSPAQQPLGQQPTTQPPQPSQPPQPPQTSPEPKAAEPKKVNITVSTPELGKPYKEDAQEEGAAKPDKPAVEIAGNLSAKDSSQLESAAKALEEAAAKKQPEEAKEPAQQQVGPNLAEALAQEEKAVQGQIDDFESSNDSGQPKKKVIQPINDLSKKPDLQALASAEEEKSQNQQSENTDAKSQ